MIETAGSFFSEWAGELELVMLFGVIIFLGTFGSRVVQWLKIPQVVGCVVVGILIGPDVLNLVQTEHLEVLEPFTLFALGIIGFMIGGELTGGIFKKYGKQFFIILFSQGIGAFLLVAVGTGVVGYFITDSISYGAAMGLLFGAVASATAPAATTNVLCEYKSKGPLTATILAIVALDDALALLLYKGAASGAKILIGAAETSVLSTVFTVFREIAGAVLLGFLAGVILWWVLKFVRLNERVLGFSIALLLLVVGNSMAHGIDPILPAMTFGATIANLARRQSKNVFDLVKKFSPPVYTAFFVLAGAHIVFGGMSKATVLMTAVYILFRVGGKVFGSGFGAELAKSPAVVKKYLGICLLPQAGVAIGLALLSGRLFEKIDPGFGELIIIVVMTETFIIELLGPVLVKIGIKRAGEVGLNVTEDDLIESYTIGEVMDSKVPVLSAGMLLNEVIEIVSTTASNYYPVVDTEGRLVGGITLVGILNTFTTEDINDWLIALDIAEPIIKTLNPEIWLSEGFETARKVDLDALPVVSKGNGDKFVGVFDVHTVRRQLSAEVLARQKKADMMH